MKRLHDTTGSTLIAAILISVIVAGITGLYLQSVNQELKETHHTRLLLESVNVAEIGVEDALYAMLNDDWTGWSSGTSGYSRRITDLPTGLGNETRQIDVFVRTSNPKKPIIVTEAHLRHPLGIEVRKQLRIDLSSGGLFMNGLTARDSVEMNGNNVMVDSYSSCEGQPYDPSTNRNDRGSVASASVEVAAVDLQNADVFGYVATGGGAPSVGRNGSVTGFDTPSGVKVDLSRVTTDFYAEFEQVQVPSMSSPITTLPSDGKLTMPEYRLSSLSLSGHQAIEVIGDVILVIDDDIAISGHGEIFVPEGSSLTIYVGGDVDITGNGVVNEGVGGVVNPANLLMYGTASEADGQTINLGGSEIMYGAVYAPFADVSMSGASDMYGSVVANTITINGNFDFHYDECLQELGGDSHYSMAGWRELDRASDRYANVLALKDGGL